jgi:hypothetical protein
MTIAIIDCAIQSARRRCGQSSLQRITARDPPGLSPSCRLASSESDDKAGPQRVVLGLSGRHADCPRSRSPRILMVGLDAGTPPLSKAGQRHTRRKATDNRRYYNSFNNCSSIQLVSRPPKQQRMSRDGTDAFLNPVQVKQRFSTSSN